MDEGKESEESAVLKNLGLVNEAASRVGQTTGGETIVPSVNQAEIQRRAQDIKASQTPEGADFAKQTMEAALNPPTQEEIIQQVGGVERTGMLPMTTFTNPDLESLFYDAEQPNYSAFSDVQRASMSIRVNELRSARIISEDEKLALLKLLNARAFLQNIWSYWKNAEIALATGGRNSPQYIEKMQIYQNLRNAFQVDPARMQIEDLPGVREALSGGPLPPGLTPLQIEIAKKFGPEYLVAIGQPKEAGIKPLPSVLGASGQRKYNIGTEILKRFGEGVFEIIRAVVGVK